MAITSVKYAFAPTPKTLESEVAVLVADGYVPFGPPAEVNGHYMQCMTLGNYGGTFEDLDARVTAAESTITGHTTSISNLNSWGTALATKLNADAGVTDTNYDTTPQS